MANVLIVFATDWGSTKKMAETVAAGVAMVEGAQAIIKPAEEATAEDNRSEIWLDVPFA